MTTGDDGLRPRGRDERPASDVDAPAASDIEPGADEATSTLVDAASDVPADDADELDASIVAEPEPETGPLASTWDALDPAPPEVPRSRFGVPATVEAVILTAIMTIAFELFLLIEPTPRWLALFAALIAALGTDGVLRAARRSAFDDAAGAGGIGADTTPYLFLPTLLALTVPVFAEYNAQGYWTIVAGLGAGLLFGVVVVAEVASVRATDPLQGAARFIAAAATYLVGFSLFSLAYAFDLGLTAALVAVAALSVLLAVELLRDGAIDPLETLLFAGIAGLVVAQARWVLQFMPIDSYFAGLTLLLVFYFVTGLMHSYMTRHLSTSVVLQYAAVAIVGVAMVIGARVAGIA